ncbi:hypothetical protein PJE062_4389 [Pseudovibrio sp. JE062]|nr:hypothetical protein PJE062_4389 [Pseudovibrio sp. JE062]
MGLQGLLQRKLNAHCNHLRIGLMSAACAGRRQAFSFLRADFSDFSTQALA